MAAATCRQPVYSLVMYLEPIESTNHERNISLKGPTMNSNGPTTMNERAKAFADLFHRHAQGLPNTLHVYTDGLVISVSGVSDRHLTVRDFLKPKFPGLEEARVGNISAFLIPMDMTAKGPEDWPAHAIAMAKRYKDHRHEDSESLDSAADFCRAELD